MQLTAALPSQSAFSHLLTLIYVHVMNQPQQRRLQQSRQHHHQPAVPTVLLHDANSSDFVNTILQHTAHGDDASASSAAATNCTRKTWTLLHWPQLMGRQSDVAAFFAGAPLVVVVVRQPPHIVIEQLTLAFDWRRLNNRSQHVVFVEHPPDPADAYVTQRFVDGSNQSGRLLTLIVWFGTKTRVFDWTSESVATQLDYYTMFDPPHVFRTIDWSAGAEEVADAEAEALGTGDGEDESYNNNNNEELDVGKSRDVTPATGFGGTEVWLVETIASALNLSVSYKVYDYASFQPDDCFDCEFYQQHYTRQHRTQNVRPARAATVSSANNRLMRKASHRSGPVVYTGVSYLMLDDLDIVAQSLYPYNYENFRIVVPAAGQHRANNRRQSELLAAWTALLVVFVALRWAVQRLVQPFGGGGGGGGGDSRSVQVLCMETLGVAFGASSARQPRHRAETVWLATLAVFALFVSICCAGVLFQRLTLPRELNGIDTLQQLVDDGRYNLMVPFSETLPPGLSESLRKNNLDIYTVNVPFILEMIWTQKPNFAYIIPESKLSIFNAPHLWHNNRCVFRVLDEIFYGRYSSLKISPWYLRPQAERTIQLANDHGQFVYFQRLSGLVSELSRVMRSNVRYPANGFDRRLSADVSYVTFSDLSFMFNAYLIGNGLAAAVFVLELWLKHVRVTVRIGARVDDPVA